MAEFWRLAGIALIIFAVCGPLTYCAVHIQGRVTMADLQLACLNARGQWKADGWASTCAFEQGRPEASAATSGPKN